MPASYKNFPSNLNTNTIAPPGQSDLSQVFKVDDILTL